MKPCWHLWSFKIIMQIAITRFLSRCKGYRYFSCVESMKLGNDLRIFVSVEECITLSQLGLSPYYGDVCHQVWLSQTSLPHTKTWKFYSPSTYHDSKLRLLTYIPQKTNVHYDKDRKSHQVIQKFVSPTRNTSI